MKGLKGDLVKYVDIEKEDLETYANAIERAICTETWYGLEVSNCGRKEK